MNTGKAIPWTLFMIMPGKLEASLSGRPGGIHLLWYLDYEHTPNPNLMLGRC